MKKVLLLIISVLLFFGILSCNLDGPGIFLTISKTTDIEDSNLAVEAVRDILYTDGTIMYLLHGTSVKTADIDEDNPTWEQLAFPKPVSEAVFVPGSPNKLFYSSVNTEDDTKTVYFCSVSTPTAASSVTGLINIQIIDIIDDGPDVYVITYDNETKNINISEINSASSNTISLTKIFSSPSPPTAVHFVSTGSTDADKHFIFVHSDETKGFINSYLNLTNLGTATLPTILIDSVFDTVSTTDNAAKDSPIIGAYAYNNVIYIITNEGILITSPDLSSFTPINKADSNDHISIVLTPSGSTAAVFSIPMTIVTKAANKLLIMGGLSGIYYYDIDGGAGTLPFEFSSSDDFYSNLSSTHILDFYNSTGVSDFSFFTATSDKWVWETLDENSSSTQLL